MKHAVVIAMAVLFVAPARVAVLPRAAAAEPTDWFHAAGWGVMTHYLGAPPSSKGGAELTAEAWNKQVDAFDVTGLTNRLASTGAKYLLFTIGQNSGHYCSPNATYDRIVGTTPSKCSRRDLIADLAKALTARNIRLMVYLPSGAPAADPVARKALGWRWGTRGGWQLPDNQIIASARQITAKGGAVTFDVPIQKSGLISQPFVAQLRAIGRSMNENASGQTAPLRVLPLPAFHHLGVVLDYKDLKYNPCDDIIIPSVIRTDHLQKPLARYYMYYAPHNAPGGICLAYANAPEGPWKEYDSNPLIARDWPPHYKVSHVSGPHAIWIDEEKKLFVYYHGENDVTRMASTADGIHFQYEGVAVTTKLFDDISEASYARVFRHTLPGKDSHYVMLLMGNNRGTRRIYLAWSKDGRTWEPRRTPLLDPPAGTNQIAQAWLFPWRGKHYLIFHGHLTDRFQTANLYAAEIDPAIERPTHLGLFYDHTSAAPDNVAQMSPCFLTDGGTIYMYTNIGPRLHQKIALAVAKLVSPGSPRPVTPSAKQPD